MDVRAETGFARTYEGQIPGGSCDQASGWIGGAPTYNTAVKYEGDASLYADGLNGIVRLDFATPLNFAGYGSLSVRLLWHLLTADLQIGLYSHSQTRGSTITVPQAGLIPLDVWHLRTFTPAAAVPAYGGGADLAALDRIDLQMVNSVPPYVGKYLLLDDWRATIDRAGSFARVTARA